jgi:FSR family fosmidomycin resistance protein-like MFS transporter
MINFFRHFVLEPLSTYLPTYINLGGASLWAAGISFSIVYLAGAIGSLLAGRYSDRLDRKLVLVGTLFASALLLVVFTFVKGWATIPLLFLLGFTANSADPVLLAIVQEQLPNNRSTGNSIYMLFSFAMRPIATLAIGWLGDQAGLQSAFLWGALISLFTLPAVLALPKATK